MPEVHLSALTIIDGDEPTDAATACQARSRS
jgi:hypothetical protein